MRQLAVAVIGCGRMGAHTDPYVRASFPPGWEPNNHAEAVKSIDGLNLVALCDTNRETAESASALHGVKAYSDYRLMLAETSPDIVTVATRADVRAMIIRDLVKAGVRGIHAEKPLCRSPREGREIAEALSLHKVAFTYGATRRYMAAYRQASERVKSGEFGVAQQIHLHFGPAALQWTHPHTVDLALFFAGDEEPERVQASFLHPVSANENVLDADPLLLSGVLRFPGGFSAIITLGGGCHMMVACEKGTVSVLSDGEILECAKPTGTKGDGYFRRIERKMMPPAPSGLQMALTALRDAVRSDNLANCSVFSALKGQQILFALALSGMRNGADVMIADVPLDFMLTGRQGNRYA